MGKQPPVAKKLLPGMRFFSPTLVEGSIPCMPSIRQSPDGRALRRGFCGAFEFSEILRVPQKKATRA
jgi:hypothetical protein